MMRDMLSGLFRPEMKRRWAALAVSGVLLAAIAAAAVTFYPGRTKASHLSYPIYSIGSDGALDNPAHLWYLRWGVPGINAVNCPNPMPPNGNGLLFCPGGLRFNWVPAFMRMSQQLSTTMMQQMTAVGAMMDADHQMDVQRLFQKLVAEAHKDYRSDHQMCRFGTNVRSLAATEAKNRVTARVLEMGLVRRETLSGDVVSSGGPDVDMRSRLIQFKNIYCNPRDSGNNLAAMCGTGGPANRINKDINFTQTVESRYTLDIDFTDTTTTPDEEDVLALSRNIFGFDTLKFIPDEQTTNEFVKDDIQDLRSLWAVRSVAYNSFSQIVGMRAQGTAGAAPFMRNILRAMGVPDNEVTTFLGTNPSYFAQMEMLTHKMYENPLFYTSLYTSPANIARIGVSLQAIGLMQDRDRYESALRREMLISMILEMKLRDHQDEITNSVLKSISELHVSPID